VYVQKVSIGAGLGRKGTWVMVPLHIHSEQARSLGYHVEEGGRSLQSTKRRLYSLLMFIREGERRMDTVIKEKR
jgi:hypothetical protein